jgi:GNAT superfamily N-acetyltransferase
MAGADDASALAALRYEFRSEMGQALERRDAIIRRCADWMAQRLSGEARWRCWISESAVGEATGALWVSLIEKVPNPGDEIEWYGYITNVYVRPPSRGAGIASALLAEALTFCRQFGVDSVVLWPSELSRPLYGRAGFMEPRDMLELVINRPRMDSSSR